MRNLNNTQHPDGFISLNHSSTNQHSSLAAARQAALHETIVRSLLQLKHNQQSQDLVASLQQHQQQQQHQQHQHQQHQHHQHQHQAQRGLLESLASLSSAGTGSIVDPASNSPTERTATPPSGPPSPSLISAVNMYNDSCANNNNNNNMALNLAKSSSASSSSALMLARQQVNCDTSKLSNSSSNNNNNNNNNNDDDDFTIEVDDIDQDRNAGRNINQVTGARYDNGNNSDDDDDDDEHQDGDDARRRIGCANDVDQMAGSPLDGTKKVRKFLEDQMSNRAIYDERSSDNHQHDERLNRPTIKRELLCEFDDDDDDDDDDEGKNIVSDNNSKRPKLNQDDQDLSSMARSLIAETCSRRDCQLDESALGDAIKYTQCFLDILIDDAALIASHSSGDGEPQSASGKSAMHINGKVATDDPPEANDAETKATTNDECIKLKLTNDVADEINDKDDRVPRIDASSLSLALKLIPSKLIAAVQQQVNGTQAITSQASTIKSPKMFAGE